METESNDDPVVRAIESLQSAQAAMTLTLASFIATHPNYAAMQLHLTRSLEMADAGAGWAPLTPRQRHQAREMVEWMQAIRSTA